MSNAPVYYALAQVVFDAFPEVYKHVPAIHTRLRIGGYAQIEERHDPQVIVKSSDETQLPEPIVDRSNSWHMSHINSTSGYIVRLDELIYHTTRYQTPDELIAQLLKGWDVVADVIKPPRVVGLSIRLLSAVLPQRGETVNEYLNSGLHGFRLGDYKQEYAMIESVYETNLQPDGLAGSLICRAYRFNGVLGLPPDTPTHQMTAQEKFVLSEPIEHAVLDTSHTVSAVMTIDADGLTHRLHALHDSLDSVLYAMTTPYAHQKWA